MTLPRIKKTPCRQTFPVLFRVACYKRIIPRRHLASTSFIAWFKLQDKYRTGPPPPTRTLQGGRVHVPHFSGNGLFWAFVSGRFSLEKNENGVYLNQSPEISGIFLKLPKKFRNRGMILFVHISRPSGSLPRNRGRALIISVHGRGPPIG